MILGRTREAREEVCEEAEVVCSVRIVVLWAMQELRYVSVLRIERSFMVSEVGVVSWLQGDY